MTNNLEVSTLREQAREIVIALLDTHGLHMEANGLRNCFDRLDRMPVYLCTQAVEQALRSTPSPDDPVVRQMVEALEWALPLASRALEEVRTLRLQCGHNDIRGTNAKGNIRLGLHQSEIDAEDNARAALAAFKGRV